MATEVKNDVVAFSVSKTIERAMRDAKAIAGGRGRVVTLVATNGMTQSETVGYLPVVEGNACPCCLQQVETFGDLS